MDDLINIVLQEIERSTSSEDLKEIEIKFLGKKGIITELLRGLKDLPPDQRRSQGEKLNTAKGKIEEAIKVAIKRIEREEIERRVAEDWMDISIPGIPISCGHLHPLTIITDEIEDIFERMGFYILDYPEAENDFYNFESLNIPKDHPARDMQDTFYLEDGNLLRTHTSSGQVRAMKEIPPPFRAIFPGRVYRFEATDASHEHTFNQVEGLMVDRHVSVSHLLGSMMTLLKGVFKRDVEVRLRPGYFPFVEPGFELDIRCMVCAGRGCSVCKHSGWVELLPCGLVHPNVLRAGGLDPDQWEGWAFGLGLSRLVMMRYEIDDIRYLMSGDLRFIRQF